MNTARPQQHFVFEREARETMIKTSINVQDLRRRIATKAKA